MSFIRVVVFRIPQVTDSIETVIRGKAISFLVGRLLSALFLAMRHVPEGRFKGARWLLLKNPENLRDDRNERARLEEALSMNKTLAAAYYMKEDLRLLWSLPDKAAAEAHLQDWIARAEAPGIRILKDFAKTLRNQRRGIFAYYKHRISAGPLEGTNNRIKTLQCQAYGFRDRAFFMLRIYAFHSTRCELVVMRNQNVRYALTR